MTDTKPDLRPVVVAYIRLLASVIEQPEHRTFLDRWKRGEISFAMEVRSGMVTLFCFDPADEDPVAEEIIQLPWSPDDFGFATPPPTLS